MRRPPAPVAFVARTHWTVGAVIVVSVVLVHFATRNVPRIEFGPRTYLIAGGLGFFYLLAGTLVWFGSPFGRLLSRVCSLLYLPRPSFGGPIWDTMNSPDYQAYFTRRRHESQPRQENDLNRRP